jgi:GNAT superfamily N-acetyltransferase
MFAGPPADDHTGDVVFRLATPSDMARLDGIERYRAGSVQRRALQEDDGWFFVACRDDQIVAARRYSRTIPRQSVIARAVELRPDQLYGADAFCLPEYRSRGIIRLLGLFAMRYFASLGYKENLGAINVRNTPSLRMSRRKGTELFCYVSCRRVLFWERLTVSTRFPEEVEAAWAPHPR